MGRRFDTASLQYITFGTPNGYNFTYGTVAFVINCVTNPTLACVYSTNDQGIPSFSASFTAGNLHTYDGTSDRSGTAFSTGVTYTAAITKDTGTATARYHQYRADTQTWTHGAYSGTTVDGGSVTDFAIGADGQFGGDEMDAELFAIATWNGYAMSDNETERLARGRWLDFGPDFYDEFTGHNMLSDMMTTLGRYRVKQTAVNNPPFTRGTAKPPAGFRFAIQRNRR